MKRFLCLFLSLLMLLTAGCALAEGGADAKVITDQIAPVVKSIVADQETYAPGDTVYITVEVTDKSGFGEYSWPDCELNVEYTDKDGMSGYAYPYLDRESMDIDGTTATLLFTYTLPEGVVPGKYYVDYISISDVYGNAVHSTYPYVCQFTVKNQNPAPMARVISVKANKTSASHGDQVKLTATVENGLQADYAGSAYFYNEESWEGIDFTFNWVSGNKYEAIATVPQNISNGIYRLSNINFSNPDWIQSYNYPDLSFKVKGKGSEESERPTVTSVKLNKTKFTDGGTIRVTVKTDAPLVEPETCELWFGSGNKTIWMYGLTKVGKNEYQATYEVRERDVAGAYTYEYLCVNDPDTGYLRSCPNDSDCGSPTFMLYDKKFVKLQSFTLNKSKVTVYMKYDSSGNVALRMKSWKPANASVLSLDFSSSDHDIGWMSTDGTFYPYNPGKTVITATAKDGSGKTATCTITVKKVTIDKIKLNKSKLSLRKGKAATLTATLTPAKNLYNDQLYWYSDNTDVAKVDSAGNVYAVGKGNCTIYAAAQDGGDASAATCKVTVK